MATEDDLIVREAQRRCQVAEIPLDFLACEDRRFRHDDRRPWWEAMYVDRIRGEIDRLRRAGFEIRAHTDQ